MQHAGARAASTLKWLVLGTVCMLGLPSPGAASPPASEVRNEARVIYQNLCANCHGPKGEGNAALKSPSIAGLPDWYVSTQLENFRHDRRGAHPQDVEGQMMRAMAKLLSPAQTAAMARHVASLPRVTPPATIVADTTSGRELYAERCMECHRYNATGELFFGSPPLLGLQDWYLASQIRKFQQGIRGADARDANGQKMIFSSRHIDDESTLQSLVAYLIEMQKPRVTKPPATTADPFEAAAQKAK